MRHLIFICILLLTEPSFSQNDEANLNKYWSLRQRFDQYFIVPGIDWGQGAPIGIRNINNKPNIDVADAPNYMGTYLAMLATEYHLLKIEGKPTYNTTKQLFEALWAINRWDDCENHYPYTDLPDHPNSTSKLTKTEDWDFHYKPNSKSKNSLNGFMVRNDWRHEFLMKRYYWEPKELYPENFNHLNANLNLSGNPKGDSIYLPWMVHGFEDQTGGINPDLSKMDSSSRISFGSKNFPLIDWLQKTSGLSQDHITSLMFGLAFVKKFIPDSITYQGQKLNDLAENKSLKNGAVEIAKRLINYMQQDFGNKDYFKLKDGLKQEIPDAVGGNAFYLSHGFVEAAKWITNNNNSILYVKRKWNRRWKMVGLVVKFKTNNAWMFGNLSCVIEGKNKNKQFRQIYNRSFSKGILKAKYDWRAYYPLAFSVLHDYKSKVSKKNIAVIANAIQCLNTMNLKGPYFIRQEECGCISDQDSLRTIGWSNSHVFHDSVFENNFGELKKCKPNSKNCKYNKSFSFCGLYSGLEYMLLYNLYTIAKM